MGITSLLTASVLRNAALFAGMLCILVGGTWAVVNATTDHLLYENATSTARSWAEYLASNATDLEQIAGGERPSVGSMAFFEQSRKSDQVFRYEIYDRHGYSLLVSDHSKVALVDISEFSADAARAAKTGQAVVGTSEGIAPDQPSFLAQAFVPVLAGGRVIAVVAAYVDQTEQRNTFYATFLKAAAALCLLTGLSFGVPTIAWYRRTKEKQIADRRIRFLAHHDALTGLPNRVFFGERLAQALTRTQHGEIIAMHLLDLDRFKMVNDTMGHPAGDKLLQMAADRLRAAVRGTDTIARMGGDEFAILQVGLSGPTEAATLAHRIIANLSEPYEIDGHQAVIGASVGIAVSRDGCTTSDELVRKADLALYGAKADGRGTVRFFEAEMHAQVQERLNLEQSLRNALAAGEFELHYQPLVDIGTNAITGLEALIRWRHPDKGLLLPDAFIPLAEEVGLIIPIGEWVLREACTTAAKWPPRLRIAVNLSPVQFRSAGLVHCIGRALRMSALSPDRLELEITEGTLLGDSEATLGILYELRALGISVAIAGFGTGYSSLTYLQSFPFDRIKIDRSFIRDIAESPGSLNIVRAVIALARGLGMVATAEGVETMEQRSTVASEGCTEMQGFLFSKALPANEIEQLLLLSHDRRGADQERGAA
ncbi:MAG: EAL domain-containing protein [Tardiphaga sp.]